MTTLTPLFQKANLIFGMGMLEMGITFSFQQLILDNAIIDDIKAVTSQTKLPNNMNESAFVRDLVALYKGQITPVAPEHYRSFRRLAKNYGNVQGQLG